MGIRGKTIKLKIRHIKDLDKLRTSKEVKLELILPAEVLVPLVRGEVIDLLVNPDLRDKVTRVEEMYLYAVGTIIDTLESVGSSECVHVDRWDIEL
ncbi:hypothetical protein ACFX2G_042050 [Malus domestica]